MSSTVCTLLYAAYHWYMNMYVYLCKVVDNAQ